MKLTGNRCQCAECGEYFNSVAAFDKHRVGNMDNRWCLPVEEMEAQGMGKNKAGYWVTAFRKAGGWK